MAFRVSGGVLIALAMASAAACSVAEGQNFTWNGVTGAWNDPTKWVNGTIPQGLPTDQVILPSGGYTTTVTADHDPWVINGITLNGGGPTVAASNSNGLQFDGASPYIVQLGSVDNFSNVTINSPVVLAQTLTYSTPNDLPGAFATATVTTLTGPISGPAGLVLQSGRVLLNAPNSFAGGVTLQGTTTLGGGLINGVPNVQGTQLFIHDSQSLGTGTLTLNGTNGLTTALFFAATSTAFNNDISVTGPSNDFFTYANSGTTPTGVATFGHLAFQSDNSVLTVGGSYNQNLGTSTLLFQGIVLGGNSTIHNQNSLLTTITPGPISETSGAHSITITDAITLNMNVASTYSGGTYLSGLGQPIINANISNALGTGGVVLNSGTVNLNANTAANNSVSATAIASVINYNANGAAGGHLVTAGTMAFGGSVNSFSTGTAADTFATIPGGVISGSGAILAQLDRNTNFTPGFATTLQNNDGGLPTSLNLGTNADILIGLAQNYASNLTLGSGTPWLGIAGNYAQGLTISYNGILTVRSNVVLQGLILGSSAASSFGIVPDNGINPVPVTLRDISLQLPLANYSGVSKFILGTGNLTLPIANALGGGGGTNAVPLDVSGNLTVSNSTALNGNVNFHAGSALVVNAPGLSGPGILTRDSQPMSITLGDTNALTGSQLSASFIQPGDAVLLTGQDIVGLKNVNPAANFTIPSLFFGSSEQVDGFNLNGGSLFLSGNSGSLAAGPTKLGDSTIRVGTLGATLAGSGQLINSNSFGDSTIKVPIIALGPVAFGFAGAPSGANKSGAIVLTSTANQFNAVTINGITLIATSPATISGANITLDGGTLALLSAASPFIPPAPTLFNNTVTISQNATISDIYNSFLFSISPQPSATNAIALSTVNLSTATLTLQIGLRGSTINTLNLTGNGTIAEKSTYPATFINVTQSGTTPLALTLNTTLTSSPFGGSVFTGTVNIAGPITIGTSDSAEFDGVVASSTAPLTVSIGGSLSGTGAIHRLVIFSAASTAFQSLAPRQPGRRAAGAITSTPAGTLTVDALTLSSNTRAFLSFATPGTVGGSTNDLINVIGDLTLDGSLSASVPGPGTYTLFTYGGNLTDDGLALPTIAGDSLALDLSTPGEVNLVVTAAPEPATLALAAPLAVFLLRRKRTR